jgi:hypothetical protein
MKEVTFDLDEGIVDVDAHGGEGRGREGWGNESEKGIYGERVMEGLGEARLDGAQGVLTALAKN